MTEFMIRNVLCQVIPEEDVKQVLGVANETNTPLQVVGNCLLEGRRYLVLSKKTENVESAGERPCDLLTRRELQVALMVCQGRGNKQIAHLLHLSEWTISSYLRRIYAKFGVSTRAAMVAKLLACDLNEQMLDPKIGSPEYAPDQKSKQAGTS